MAWLCICGTTNASLNSHCASDRTLQSIEHYQITPSTYDSSLYWTAEGRVNKLLMTPNEELHQKFFNEEAALVINLNDAELEEHIQELEMIAREAKARIIAAGEERRNRKAKSGSKGEWQIAPTGPDVTVTDSINKVKQRGSRISKLDKMRDKLAELGLSDNEINQMIAKMVSQARKDRPQPNVANTGIISDEQREANKEARKEGTAVPQIQPIVIAPMDTKPLDLSKLKFT